MTVIITNIDQISKQSEIIVFIHVFKLISNLTYMMMIAKSLLLIHIQNISYKIHDIFIKY